MIFTTLLVFGTAWPGERYRLGIFQEDIILVMTCGKEYLAAARDRRRPLATQTRFTTMMVLEERATHYIVILKGYIYLGFLFPAPFPRVLEI